MKGLLDTSFLLAVLDADDKRHTDCAAALLEEEKPLLPDVVLPELAYMVVRELGYSVMNDFLSSISKGDLLIERITIEDLKRTREILKKYSDSSVSFVDCAIVALSERLKIERILTLDHRHFELFRPRHCQHFIIIP